MTIVNSWNEWDPLRHVIVGTVENSNVPPMEPALEPKISKDSGMVGSHGPRSKESIDKANIQLDNFIKILQFTILKLIDQPQLILQKQLKLQIGKRWSIWMYASKRCNFNCW